MTDNPERVQKFMESTPTLENYWRAVILFGRNVASYKFALARSLLELRSESSDLVKLEDLAEPFSRHICEHLRNSEKQATSPSSRFLAACAAFNQGEISAGQLISSTIRLGFNNVIDAFHNVNQQEVPARFFIDERQNGGIRLTDAFFALRQGTEARSLPDEVESRWRLVETAWALNLSSSVVAIGYDDQAELLYSYREGRRKTVTSCRGALNGYQKGRCFYCSLPVSIVPGEPALADVDHFFPHALAGVHEIFRYDINGVWNLVLSCVACNRGKDGKSARIPDLVLLERLHRRNEYLISSHHPLRETIRAQTGETERVRRDFLQTRHRIGLSFMIHTWYPMQHFKDTL